jgi:hypothetical protein
MFQGLNSGARRRLDTLPIVQLWTEREVGVVTYGLIAICPYVSRLVAMTQGRFGEVMVGG